MGHSSAVSQSLNSALLVSSTKEQEKVEDKEKKTSRVNVDGNRVGKTNNKWDFPPKACSPKCDKA